MRPLAPPPRPCHVEPGGTVRLHWEEIVYLAALTHDQAILAWGRFPVALDGDRAELIDQSDPRVPPERQRLGFVGHESPSWGPSRVRLLHGDHEVAVVEATANFVVLRDLASGATSTTTSTGRGRTTTCSWRARPGSSGGRRA